MSIEEKESNKERVKITIKEIAEKHRYFMKSGRLFQRIENKVFEMDLEKVKRDNPWVESRIKSADYILTFIDEQIVENISLLGSKNGYKNLGYKTYSFEINKNPEEKFDTRTDGRGKLKLAGNLVGKGIKDSKESFGGMEVAYELDNSNSTLNIKLTKGIGGIIIDIVDFRQGDYGLWLDEEAPYIYEDGSIVDTSTQERLSLAEIREFSENEFLFDENRIEEDYLWIHKEEKIKMNAEEVEESDEVDDEALEGEEVNENNNNLEEGNEEEGEEVSSININIPSLLKVSPLELEGAKGGGNPIVINGAQCSCSSGTAIASLTVVTNQLVKLDNQLVATVMDGTPANFTPFGGCINLTNPSGIPPCPLALTGKWSCPDSGFKVAGIEALTKNGRLQCSIGGMVTIVQPGQVIHKTKK